MAVGWTEVDYDVALEVASHEAVIRKAYKDSVGKWTWSVGLTSATGHGVERYIGNPQDLAYCLAVYAWALNNYAEAVRDVFQDHPLTKAQFAAALSFHWNTGAIRKASWVRKWKAGDVAGARRAFMNWNKPPEITGRRRKERDLFFDGKWSNNGTMTEYTRLTRNHHPVWGSAVRRDVRKELSAAFETSTPEPVVDRIIKPDAPVDQPTLSPSNPTAAPVPPAPAGPRKGAVSAGGATAGAGAAAAVVVAESGHPIMAAVIFILAALVAGVILLKASGARPKKRISG